MTEKANNLLQRMVVAVSSGHENDFDMEFYMSAPESALSELERQGFIIRKKNIIGSIALTEAGYIAGMK